MDNIARKWRELSGQSNWEGMLDPLDNDLRRYLIHYGQLAQATYDAFNSEKASKYAGNSRYPKRDFFSKLGLENNVNPFKYSVTKFLYATVRVSAPRRCFLKLISKEEWSVQSNWIGYVAVATNEGKEALGRRDIVVAWRGTIQPSEWVENLNFDLDPAPQIFGADAPAQIHDGFYNIYTTNNSDSPLAHTSARDQVLEEVKRLVEEYKEEEISITVTGHSLGAALATINALDIVAKGLNIPKDQPEKPCPVTAFVFASPRLGNSEFGRIFNGFKDLRALRIRNATDLVPNIPFSLFPFRGFLHVGKELVIDTRKSEYLKNGVSSHSLEIYLHGVAGTQGKQGGFNWDVNPYRNVAHVNKNMDALKDEFGVPVEWRVNENKSLAQQSDGTWKIMDDHEDAIPCLHCRLIL
ncbi:hypothetical protein VNO78_11902 [Psophocarpus tetragonolobus]|uniref:Phospholipase A1 n=1 Tax=Psophocarpus tetragonolobus TaxID=3891 RepID=A0AAN9XNU9_PSOTE